VDRALWFVGPRQVEIRPVELPALAGDDARVRTVWSGVSAGTEMLAYRGELPEDLEVDESIGALGGTFRYPFRYGYSCVGRIEALGPTAERFAVGDLVFAFHSHQERFVTTGSNLVPIPTLEPRVATLLPYVETALQITLDAGQLLGETVVVSGLGALGLLVGLLVERAGGRVVAIEPQAWRRTVAADLGLTAVDSEHVVGALGGSDVHLAIECSGAPAALAFALELLAHEGTVLVASWYGSTPVSLPLGGRFHRRRLTIRSTQVSTIPAALSGRWTKRRRLSHAVELAAALPLAALATDTVPFERAGEGFNRVDAGAAGLIHMAFGYA
jgi:2-desacetyl-2-hydroxyethyl bacteriochlorophyllide A dehydrogenase